MAIVVRSTFAFGYALFAWVYLVFVLHGGFGFASEDEFHLLSTLSLMGVGLAIVCGLVVARLARAVIQQPQK